MIHEKNWRVSLCGQELSALRNSVIQKILPEFLQPFLYVGMSRVCPYLLVILISTTLLKFLKSTGLTVLVKPHFRLTQLKMSWLMR